MNNKETKKERRWRLSKSIWGTPFHIYDYYKIKRSKKALEADYNRKISELPKEFNYYCPSCLYQTNDYVKICPKCNNSKLSATTSR